MLLKLDLQYFAGEKTEKATPKKREDERKKGRVAKSQEINTSIILLFGFISLALLASFMKETFSSLYFNTFTEYIHWDVTSETVMNILRETFLEVAKVLAPIMGIVLVAAILGNVAQVGFLFTTEPLKFDLKKIDPIKGAKRIFSLRALVELLKSSLKITFIGVTTFAVIWMFKDDMMMMAYKNTESAIAFFGRVTLTIGIAATLALLFLSVFDYAYQKYDFEKSIRMSKQDIKDEFKNIEGDPLIQSRIKQKQREIAMRRMMSEVPQADVVITNPTHYAIAIKYDEEKASAPYVVALGVDEIALKIREIAEAHGVMTVENRELARNLYDAVELGDVIPEEFYQAVAEILAYVYRVENKL